MKSVSDLDLSYFAGLIDGEGWIGVQKYEEGYRIHLAVNMTNEDAIRGLQEIFGGNYSVKVWPNGRWKDQYCWRLAGTTAIPAIKLLLPFLRIKRQQATIVLESNWERFNGRGIPDDERKLRHSIWKRLKFLNRKNKE